MKKIVSLFLIVVFAFAMFSVSANDGSVPPGFNVSKYYDESVMKVSVITGYDTSRGKVLYSDVVAICSSPAVITAEDNLMNMAIAKLEKVNGEWKEIRYLDSWGINLGDPTKNWYGAEGYEFIDDPHYEYTGNLERFEGFEPVKKGTSVSLSEPGIYYIWAATNDEKYTELTIEIGDSVATYTNSKVLVDGKEVKFEAYKINNNNYFKLRDIAYALTNYGVGGNFFNVKWDGTRNMINLETFSKYEAVGGELKEGDGKNKSYQISTSAIMKDGSNVTLSAFLINGNNYFKLRDLGKLMGFNVSWDGANNCILIDSTSSYME